MVIIKLGRELVLIKDLESEVYPPGPLFCFIPIQMKNEMLKSKIFKGVKKNILLKNHTTFKIGGPARYFFKAKTKESLIEILKWAKEKRLPFFILGGGSNVLFPDDGYNGLVINFQSSITELSRSESKGEGGDEVLIAFNFQKNEIITGGGAKLKELVEVSARKGLIGLEWAAGIPGTVGGAIRGNAGAFGVSMANSIEKVKVLDVKNKSFKIRTLSKRQCCFSSKSSIFKKNKNLIILTAFLKLKKGEKKEIQKKIKEYLNYRQENHPLEYPSAGCIFKNEKYPAKPKISSLKASRSKKKKIIPSSYLIDKAGLKGKKIGDAQISRKHANFIINLGEAKSNDVLKLISLVKKEVKKKWGVELKEELEVIDS